MTTCIIHADFGVSYQCHYDWHLEYNVRDVFSPGKCPAAPAAALPGNASRIFSQEIFLIFRRKYLSLC